MTSSVKIISFVVGLMLARGAGAAPTIPEAELLAPPTPQRIAAIIAAAQREGWAPQAAPLRIAAQNAYRRGNLPAAEAWFNVYRWTGLWGMSDHEYLPRWTEAVKTLRVGHPNMPRNFPLRRAPLGFLLLPEVQVWLLSHPAFSEEFFSLLSQVDYLPGVFQILNELHFHDPVRFDTYANLVLAIALVYEVPPPPHWPHGQVPVAALRRQLPKPVEAFKWWTRQDELGHTHHRLANLGADELKFVVDAAAPFVELEWSQQIVGYSLTRMARAYTMVRYDAGRVQRGELIWSGGTYALDDILAAGGICVDQGYFAAQAGKARGVPTLLFRGQGVDSRHAWFGFLDTKEKWQLDVGRYAEQRFVTGYVLDPQTWREISDHELRFLSERFRTLPAFRESRVHAQFGADFLAGGDATAAEEAARKAIALERRNLPAWETLLSAQTARGRDAKQREVTLREAAQAFEKYPDLETVYFTRVSESLRARGETALAEAELNRVANKNQRKREDLNLMEARRTLVRAFATQPVEEQVRTYNTLVTTLGRGAGIAFFDQVVVVFAEHMMQLQQPAEALKAVEAARQALKIQGNSQLAREIEKLSQWVRTPP
ncbi:MAG TPA: hypothetical protein VHO24_17940 [Opitutaceae bacterium]|nr:hypothetical protein [Opitutaceae bacterium]